MKKYFFNFTNNQIVQQPNYQPTNEAISDSSVSYGMTGLFCHSIGICNPITHFLAQI